MQDKGDKALFDEVFVPYLPEAFRLARSLTGNTNDAEDVVQDAAIRAFRGSILSVRSMPARGA